MCTTHKIISHGTGFPCDGKMYSHCKTTLSAFGRTRYILMVNENDTRDSVIVADKPEKIEYTEELALKDFFGPGGRLVRKGEKFYSYWGDNTRTDNCGDYFYPNKYYLHKKGGVFLLEKDGSFRMYAGGAREYDDWSMDNVIGKDWELCCWEMSHDAVRVSGDHLPYPLTLPSSNKHVIKSDLSDTYALRSRKGIDYIEALDDETSSTYIVTRYDCKEGSPWAICRECNGISLRESGITDHQNRHICGCCKVNYSYSTYKKAWYKDEDLTTIYPERELFPTEDLYSQENFHRCPFCRKWFSKGSIHTADDYHVCPSCLEFNGYTNDEGVLYAHPPISLAIHGYHEGRKHNPIKFFGSYNPYTKYIGIELEIDGRLSSYDNEHAYQILRKDLEEFYCEYDSSLNDGFEIISHPMTVEYALNKIHWEHIFKEMNHLGYDNHLQKAGVHIHVSRKWFGGDAAIGRLIRIVGDNFESITKFGGKSIYMRDHYSDTPWHKSPMDAASVREETPNEELPKYYDEYSSDRYFAVNVRPKNTIELRFFKGVTDENTMRAFIQFADILTTIAGFGAEFSWEAVAKVACSKEYEELIYEGVRLRLIEPEWLTKYQEKMTLLKEMITCA